MNIVHRLATAGAAAITIAASALVPVAPASAEDRKSVV